MKLSILAGPGEGTVYLLAEGENVAGREADCGVCLPSKRVSRKHATFEVRGLQCVVRDLGSQNGILVNGHRMDLCALTPGTQIQIGDVLLVFEDAVSEEGTTTSPVLEPDLEVPTTHGGTPVPEVDPNPTLHSAPAAGPPSFNPFDATPPPGAFGTSVFRPGDPTPLATPTADISLTPDPEVTGPSPAAGAFGNPGSGSFGNPGSGSFGNPGSGSFGNPGSGSFGAPGSGSFGAPGSGSFGAPGSGSFGAPAQPVAPAAEAEALPPHPVPRFPLERRIGGLLAAAGLVMLCGPVGGSIGLISGASDSLEEMSLARGEALAMALAARNAGPMALRETLAMDVTIVGPEEGVLNALLLDSRGNVQAPAEKARLSMKNSPAFAAASETRRPERAEVDKGWEIVVPVRAAVVEGAPSGSVVGYAYIVYDAEGQAADVANPWLRLPVSLLWIAASMAAIFLGVRKLLEPVRLLREETELAMKGHVPQVHPQWGWPALDELAHTINRALAKRR